MLAAPASSVPTPPAHISLGSHHLTLRLSLYSLGDGSSVILSKKQHTDKIALVRFTGYIPVDWCMRLMFV